MSNYLLDTSLDVPNINLVSALRRALVLYRANKTAAKRTTLARTKDVIMRVPKVVRLDRGSEKLIGMAVQSHDILFKANTAFPFNLFPDTVTVDREKLTMANRIFFLTAKITSVPIRDILNVEADVGPFFGSVHLTSRYFFTNPRSVNFLHRHDALDLQRLVQGYILAHEQHLDCSKMNKEQLVTLLEDLGKGDTD